MKKSLYSIMPLAAILLALFMAGTALAAPDEDKLGKQENYPAAPNLKQIHDPRYIVGSFSNMDHLSPSCSLAPSPHPVPLPVADDAPVFHYRYSDKSFSLDDYMQHQRVTALLVIKDGKIVAERYNYARKPDMRMLSNSMAKTILALAIGKALEDGSIHSLDDTAATYVPALKGSLYGETRIVNLLRMASGARYVENYSDHDDRSRFNAVTRDAGMVAAARSVTERAYPEGQQFNYAGAQTEVLSLVLREATHQSLCRYVESVLWQPMGAEAAATYLLNPADQLEMAQGGFNATAQDYARLGWMLASDGVVQGHAVVPYEYLLSMTDPGRQPAAFRPGEMLYHDSRYLGYGFQTWLYPGANRSFVLMGVYGQAIFVDPKRKLVMVHMAVGQDAAGDASGAHLGAERNALWRGIAASYGGE